MCSKDLLTAVKDWLEEFAGCVRNKDFTRGELMFFPDATGFGTWTKRMGSLYELREQQWRNVWPNTEGFKFDLEHAQVMELSDNIKLNCVALVSWSSIGIEGGTKFEREGCATIVLMSCNGVLKAKHTHFSQTPTGRL